jgi:Tfp pilus assembly protein PilN
MKRMHIDFAAPGWRRTLYRLHPAFAVAGIAGLLLCAGAAWMALHLSAQREARAQQLQDVRQRASALARLPAAVPQTAIPAAQANAVNAAVLQMNLPWRDLQDAVAAATPPNIALLALEPDARKQILKITAEAKNSDEMVGYIELLKQQEFFRSAALARHEIGEQDPNHPIRFQVEAQWDAR